MCGIAQVWLEKPIGFRYIKSMLFFLDTNKNVAEQETKHCSKS